LSSEERKELLKSIVPILDREEKEFFRELLRGKNAKGLGELRSR